MIDCPPPDFAPRAPRLAFPSFACDCHAHVLGPAARFPYAPERVYTPADCVLADYRRMLDTLGIARAVLVQPSVYASDNAALLDALAADPARLRGVAVVEPGITHAEIERLHRAGVRGVRCNIVDLKSGKGQLPLAALRSLAERIRPFGWHLEFLMHVDEFPDLDRMLVGFPVDVVFGHLGYLKTGRGRDDPGFRALLRLLASGRAWAKLTGPYRISAQPLPHADVTPFAHALLEANPARLLWGSDWPHVMVKGAMPNDGALADLLGEWVPDETARRRVLAENPAELYRF